MAIKNNTKRGSADLLLEIIFSAIIFFVITIILFGLRLPQQEFQAMAHVISADAAVSCELSLTNLMRANTSAGITYNDWLMNTYVTGGDLKDWKKDVEGYFNNAFSLERWDMNITLPNSTSLLGMGKIKDGTPEDEIFTCMFYAPYPAAYSQYFCFPTIPEATSLTQGKTAIFKAEGTDVKCKINIKPRLEIAEDPVNCKLDLAAKNPFEEDIPYFIDNTLGMNDTLTLPIKVAGAEYEITLYEIVDGSTANARLIKRSLLEDCSLHIILRTTNISAQI